MYKLYHMSCCLCGKDCLGRQWPNRDKGFSICSSCIVVERKDGRWTEADLRESYGVEGVHFNVMSRKTHARNV